MFGTLKSIQVCEIDRGSTMGVLVGHREEGGLSLEGSGGPWKRPEHGRDQRIEILEKSLIAMWW